MWHRLYDPASDADPASDVPDELHVFLYDGGKPDGDIPSVEKLSSPFPAKNLGFINKKWRASIILGVLFMTPGKNLSNHELYQLEKTEKKVTGG